MQGVGWGRRDGLRAVHAGGRGGRGRRDGLRAAHAGGRG